MAADAYGNYIADGVPSAGAVLPLVTISSDGGTLGGHGDPTGVVVPTTEFALYIDQDTGALYEWYDSTWH